MAIPQNLQDANIRRFKGFTPQQVQKLLEGKGLKPNSREAAMYLASMSDQAEQLLQRSKQNTMNQGQGFQMGGQVGGFDPKSQKLFDAAVKRVSGNQPQTPEVQRYLDNVIETRGRPTMVFPGSADPLQGYQQGGPVKASMGMVIDKDGKHIGYDGGPGRGLGTDGFMPLPGIDMQGKPIEGYTPPPSRTGPPDLRQQFEVGIPPFGNRRDPLPTTGAPIQQKTGLDTSQANLASAQQELNRLQQQLASTPIEDEATRNAIVEKINKQQPIITSAQSALASASQQFQTVAVPTAAEAVGATVTTPADLITKQPVDKIVEGTGQTIDVTTGKLTGDITPTVSTGVAKDAPAVTATGPAKTTVETVAEDIKAVKPQERFGQITQDAITKAQEIATQDLNIRDVQAAQGTGQQIVSPSKRALQQGELVSGAANAEQSAQFLEGIEAATGAPSSAATVQGQLTGLMTQFEGGTPPPWASGAMRQATAIMAQRGLAASSMAGQAIVQAAMESALPIAMQDAQTVASFEAQNLSNRQQRAMLAAQQRATFLGMEFDQTFQARVQNASKISDIANINFSAEQQIALENAQLAQTVDLTNLSNRQATTMAQASAIAQADMANLSNRQQAAVQNAQSFLQMDFRNLDISQQNDMFKTQSVVQGLFTDASAENASRQFNATSENQTNQFFASLKAQVGQFNATQSNSMEQYNVGQTNALEQFKQQVKNQREQFNAQNALVIAQANAQWRQQLSTINNAALNDANRQNALQANGLTQKGLDEIWQKERDLMAYAFATAESAAERRNKLLLSELDAEGKSDSAFSSALGTLGGAIINGVFGLF